MSRRDFFILAQVINQSGKGWRLNIRNQTGETDGVEAKAAVIHQPVVMAKELGIASVDQKAEELMVQSLLCLNYFIYNLYKCPCFLF